MEPSTCSRHTAAWALGLRWQDVPPEVIEDAKFRVLDNVGVMLAARDARLLAQVLATEPAVADGVAPIGFNQPRSLRGAAMVNGVASSLLEFDDSHVETGIHPTGPVLSLAAPLAQTLQRSGKDLLLAFVAGSELCCRLGQVVPGYMHRRGIHPTAVFGIFGAVYAGARLMRLDARATSDALGIAGSMAAGLMASWEDGSSAKSLHVGLAASNAALALDLARQGISGPAGVYDGRFGFFRTHAQEPDTEYRYQALTAGLGQRWELLEVAAKLYATGYVVQPFVDGILHLRQAHGLRADQVETITCGIAGYAIPLACEPVADKIKPASTWHARVSLQRSVAEALVRGGLYKDAFSAQALADPVIDGLAARVSWQADPAAADRMRLCGSVDVVLRDGSVLRHDVPAMRGTRGNRMQRSDYVDKFLANAEDVVGRQHADEMVASILALDSANDAGAVIARLRKETPA